MAVRFRIRTPGGQELSFASVEMFEDFVRAGDLSEDDLVYDAEDGSWAPARTHPIVLNIQYEEEETEDAPDPVAADGGTPEVEGARDDEAPGDEGDEAGAFGLSLAPPKESPAEDDAALGEAPVEEGTATLGLELAAAAEVSAEEARQQFLEKLQAERAHDLDFGDGGISGFQMETSGSLADLVTPEPAPPTPTPGRPAERAPAKAPSKPRPAAPAPSKGGGFGKLVAGVVLLVAIGAGSYFGFGLVRSGGEEAQPTPEPPVEAIPVEVEPEPEREPLIASTPSAVRERARERFLTATQTAFRDLPPIPEAWPGGSYLSLPSEHADVLTAWQTYLTTIQRVRSEDVERFTAAYEAALDDALIEGDDRVTRLETALAEFDASAEARAAHYDRVEALASAAIQSHNALLDSEGLLIFDGSGEGVAPGPVGAGVSARDDDSALLLQQVSDLLMDVLDSDGLGPGTGENVRAWVWDGFLGAVTN